MKVGYVYDPVYLKHDTGQHPESAARLEAIISHLEQTGLKQELVPIEPRAASVEELSLVHDRQYIQHIRDTAERGGGWLDPDTVMSPASYEAAVYAAGGAITATDAVIGGRVSSAFALVRPPGHHATPRQAMGFCLFNNLAIAAGYALSRHKLERLAIIDFDVHHGNGTQDAFYDDPRVLYVSTHEYPFYPGTGSIHETGSGQAKGTKVNIPLPAGSGDGEYIEVFEQIIMPAVRRFRPRLILVSAGYDACWADELALMRVSVNGFARMTEIITGLAGEICESRLVFCLEGGYNLQALAFSVAATFNVLLGREFSDPLGQSPRVHPAPDITRLVEEIREVHALA